MKKETISASDAVTIDDVIEVNASRLNDAENRCVACGIWPSVSRKMCDRCLAPDRLFEVPADGEFILAGAEYLHAPKLAGIGARLIDAYPDDFFDLSNARIEYLWKRKGGESKGHMVLGKLKKVSGELQFYSKVDYLMLLSADNCQLFNHVQMTALVFHELKHGFWDGEKGKYGTVGHDFEGFRREVEVFGYWKNEIKRMAESFEIGYQIPLFDKKAKSERS